MLFPITTSRAQAHGRPTLYTTSRTPSQAILAGNPIHSRTHHRNDSMTPDRVKKLIRPDADKDS